MHPTSQPARRPDASADAPQRWPAAMVLIHWMTVALITAGVTVIYGRVAVEGRSLRELLLWVHQGAGLLVWAAACARLVLRLFSAAPRRRTPGKLAGWAAAATHVALYALLMAVPLLGWALSSARGPASHALWPGWPALVDPDPDLADTLESAHAIAAWSLLGLTLLHALAAAWHYLILRDDVMASMSFARTTRSPAESPRTGPFSPPSDQPN